MQNVSMACMEPCMVLGCGSQERSFPGHFHVFYGIEFEGLNKEKSNFQSYIFFV